MCGFGDTVQNVLTLLIVPPIGSSVSRNDFDCVDI